MSIWSKTFWQAVIERMIRTFAYTLAGLLGGDGLGLIGEQHWYDHLSVAGMAALTSLLVAVGTNAVTGTGPSWGAQEVLRVERQPNSVVPPTLPR